MFGNAIIHTTPPQPTNRLTEFNTLKSFPGDAARDREILSPAIEAATAAADPESNLHRRTGRHLPTGAPAPLFGAIHQVPSLSLQQFTDLYRESLARDLASCPRDTVIRSEQRETKLRAVPGYNQCTIPSMMSCTSCSRASDAVTTMFFSSIVVVKCAAS